MREKCRSPLKPSCGREDIAVVIRVGDRMLPICRECWRKLARMNAEWGLNQYHGSVKFNNFHNFSNRDETGAVAQHR